MKEIKVPTTHDEQIAKLESRGCIIEDKSFTRRVLTRINYYRLTAYFIPFRDSENNNKYVKGTSFNRVYAIYEFDRQLRGLLLSVLEEIEVSLRAHLSHYYSHKYGALGYMNSENFSARHDHIRFEESITKRIERNKRQPFVEHHIAEYDSKFPLWVMVELFTFGDLSKFYADMSTADQKGFVRTFCKFKHNTFESWLFCANLLRNYCAHYSRLYYSLLPALPKKPFEYPNELGRNVFSYIMILNFLQRNRRSWNNSFMVSLSALMERYKTVVNLSALGFPENWKALLEKDYMDKS